VLEEGRGIYQWRESEHIFLSENRETAFQEALRIGRKEEHALLREERGPDIECRFAEIVYLEELAAEATAFEVFLGEKEATERIGYDHVFRPEERVPPPTF
jgi:hypothetical protein